MSKNAAARTHVHEPLLVVAAHAGGVLPGQVVALRLAEPKVALHSLPHPRQVSTGDDAVGMLEPWNRGGQGQSPGWGWQRSVEKDCRLVQAMRAT